MKKLIIMSAIAMSGLIYNTANAQIGIHVGFHLGPRRVYTQAPVVVEQAPVYDDSNNDYYYLPDVNAYYNVDEQCYYYYDGDNWISAAYLPGAYRDYDWRNATRYEVRATRPYLHNDIYRARYNGHEVGDWARNSYNNHYNESNTIRSYRENEQRFDNRGQFNNDRRFDNGGNRGNEQRFDNRGRENVQPQQNNERRTEQRPDNRGQNNNSQPSNQNNGRERENRSNDRYAQNSPQGGSNTHRMSRF